MGIAQDKQKMLLASDNAHFSMIRFVQWNPSAYGLDAGWLVVLLIGIGIGILNEVKVAMLSPLSYVSSR